MSAPVIHVKAFVRQSYDHWTEDVVEFYGPLCLKREMDNAAYAQNQDLSDATCKNCRRILVADEKRRQS